MTQPRTQIETVQMLAQAKKRTWKRATKDQRREILARYEATQSVRKAFASIKAFKVTDADLQWFGQRVGGGR